MPLTFPNSVVIKRVPSWGTIRKSPSELENALLFCATPELFVSVLGAVLLLLNEM